MKDTLNYEIVPSSEHEDFNQGKSVWINGSFASLDEGTHVTLFIGHQQETMTDEHGDEVTETRAFPIRVEKTVTRAKAINAAEMSAYGLNNAMDVASLNAALARKSRINPEDSEVAAHDDFIEWVKDELTKINIL